MESFLCFDIYGVKIKIKTDHFYREKLKKLFLPFQINCKDKGFIEIEFFPKEDISEIVSVINPFLSKRKIWGFHGAGIIYKEKGYVFLGKSGAGKSTLIRISLRNGLKIIGDDVILMRENKQTIEVLPLFFAIQGERNYDFLPYSCFSKGKLDSVFIISGKEKVTSFKPISKEIAKKEMFKYIFWELEEALIKEQLYFLEKLSLYPTYLLFLGYDILFKENKLIDILRKNE